MKNVFAIGITVLLSLGACNKAESSTAHSEHDLHATHEHSSETAHEEPSTGATLSLNEGEKWVTNVEMHPFVAKQEALLQEFDPKVKSYSTLGQEMEAINEDLIKNCTMSGKPHDMLHVWLTDHMNTMQSLRTSTDEVAGQMAFEKMKTSLNTYHQYFK